MNDSVVKTWEIYRTFFVSYRWMDGEMGGDWHGSSSVSQYIFRKSDDSKVSIPRFNVWKSISNNLWNGLFHVSISIEKLYKNVCTQEHMK